MRTNPLARSLSLPLALSLVAACDDAGPEGISYRPGTGNSCSCCTSGLGNSPMINGSPVEDLKLDGTPNIHGVALVGLQVGNTIVQPSFDLGLEEFTAFALDGVALRGADLVGAAIVVNVQGKQHFINIHDYDGAVPSWAEGQPPISVYKGSYTSKSGAVTPLCNAADADQQWFTLVGGDVFDRADNSLLPASPDQISIACVNEAIGKMKLLDYHSGGTLGTTSDERTATLRMITADYCGTGHSFTTSGVQVAWRDARGAVEPPFAENTLEALWGPGGAICLNTPRLVPRSVVDKQCSIPTCEEAGEFGPGVVWRTMLP